jgi:dipeptidase E
VAERHIVGMGGAGESDEQTWLLYDYILGLARGTRILYVPTAARENPELIVLFYERFRGRAECATLRFFPWPTEGMRELVLAQDVIVVGGGNTANMLAIWRVHGFDASVREAWENGTVLCGTSAGMICWFEAGVTDSFGPQLEGMRDGLGFLAGSACPHTPPTTGSGSTSPGRNSPRSSRAGPARGRTASRLRARRASTLACCWRSYEDFSAGVQVPGCSVRAGTVRVRSPAARRSRCERTVYAGSAALALPAS